LKAELPKVYKRRKTRSFLLRLNPGALVQALLILLFPCFLAAQSEQVILVSCENKTPIDGAYVLNESTGKVLGYSNKQGRVIIFSENIEWPLNLKIYKMSALDTSIVLTQGKTSVCLNPNAYQLSAFEVISEKEDIAESFRKYVDKTVSKLNNSDTTHYYSFTWDYSMPDSNWNMHLEGLIELPEKAYSKKYSGAQNGKFCRLSISLDSSLYFSQYLDDYQFNHIPFYFMNHGCVRRGFAYQKKISDEMILKKWDDAGGSTRFIYSNQISKNWLSKGWKMYLGYPVFNKDSILVQNESEYQLIDTIGKQKEDYNYLGEYDKQEFAIIDGSLVQTSLKIKSEIRHKSGSISRVNFSASLFTEPIDRYEEVNISKHFTKKNLDQLNKMEGYEVILE
jgi:hypothetical protein